MKSNWHNVIDIMSFIIIYKQYYVNFKLCQKYTKIIYMYIRTQKDVSIYYLKIGQVVEYRFCRLLWWFKLYLWMPVISAVDEATAKLYQFLFMPNITTYRHQYNSTCLLISICDHHMNIWNNFRLNWSECWTRTNIQPINLNHVKYFSSE